MDKSLTSLLTFSIIGGYFLLGASLFWFLGVSGSAGINVVTESGALVTVVFDPYKYNVSNNGIIYVLSFGIAGAIFIYVFLIAPTVNAYAQTPGLPEPSNYKTIGGVSNVNVDRLQEQMTEDKFQEETNTMFGENKVITIDLVRQFVGQFPETALMFALRKSPVGAELDDYVKQIFMEWEIKGLNQQIVEDEIRELLQIESLPDSSNFSRTVEYIKEKFGSGL